MNYRELRKTIALIGVFMVAVLLIHHTFAVLSPMPESPEMARAEAEVFVNESDVRLQIDWLKSMLWVGAATLFSGVIIVTFGLWAATRFVLGRGGTTL